MIYNKLLCEYDSLKTKYEKLNSSISSLPEGNLLCVKNGNYTKWFISNGSNPIYIPKSQKNTAELLALKKHYQFQLLELSKEMSILSKCISQYEKIKSKSSDLLDDTSAYNSLIKTHFETYSEKISDWINSDYIHNTNHPEHLIHKTNSGEKVRSKSEVIIANALYSNKVPYRYECGVHFGDNIFFPDFTICHPQTLEIYYWEHFGMMDNQSYRDNSYNKLKIYSNYGIIPSINLITTYETLSHPIDSEKIQQTISEYFL